MFRRGSLIGNRHTGSRPSLFRRRRVAGEGLVDRDVVGMAVSDLPLTVLATEGVSDAQGVRLDRDTDDRICDVFEADHVRQVPADVGG
jgi:hypothetical protein